MIAGSIIGASKLMNVTQPGVSRSMGLLEDRLGYALFSRRGRRIVPTPEAEALYREVERTYRSLEAITQVAHDIGVQRAGALRVATLPALADWLVPQTISQFLSSRPAVKVFVQSLPSVQIADLVSTHQLDVGIVEMPVSRPAIEIVELGTSPAVVVMPAGHRLTTFDRISVKDLAGERMILLSQHSLMRYKIDDAFSSASVAPTVVMETPSSALACALVAANVGVTIVSQVTAIPLGMPAVVIRPLHEAITSRYALVLPQLTARSGLSKAFIDHLRTVFDQPLG